VQSAGATVTRTSARLGHAIAIIGGTARHHGLRDISALVEVWYGIVERQAIHRGTFGSVRDLNAKMCAFIDGWNDRCHPFTWTKTADEVLKKVKRRPT